MNVEKVIFHGGCLDCNSQEIYGKHRCTGCQYFEANWQLPNLSTGHAEEEKRMKRIRAEFRNEKPPKDFVAVEDVVPVETQTKKQEVASLRMKLLYCWGVLTNKIGDSK